VITRDEHNGLITRLSALLGCADGSPEREELRALGKRWREVGAPEGGYDVPEPVVLRAMIALSTLDSLEHPTIH
jgi:hypothetical protein